MSAYVVFTHIRTRDWIQFVDEVENVPGVPQAVQLDHDEATARGMKSRIDEASWLI